MWRKGRKDVWMDRRMCGEKEGRMYGWIDECVEKRKEGCMDG